MPQEILTAEENERIREALIRFHKSTIDIDGIKGGNIIAWLEKQADKDKLIKELGKYKVKYTQEVLSQQLEKQSENLMWTEEDECYMSECIRAIITKDGWSFKEKLKTEHWLKSIKQRIYE